MLKIPRSVSGFVQVFSVNTTIRLKIFAMAVYPVHTVFCYFSNDHKTWLNGSLHTLEAFIMVETETVKGMRDVVSRKSRKAV